MIKQWPTYIVRYWNHDPRVNDCFGNSISWVGKARTSDEAMKKAELMEQKKWYSNHHGWFRVESIKRASWLDILTINGIIG